MRTMGEMREMGEIDAFAHILPRPYLDRLERQLERTMAPSQLAYCRERVFTVDPALTDLDARWRAMDRMGQMDRMDRMGQMGRMEPDGAQGGAYTQVLVLAAPPLEEVARPAIAAELARLANDELAD